MQVLLMDHLKKIGMDMMMKNQKKKFKLEIKKI